MALDALYRTLYRLAFRFLRLWWRVRRPAKAGAALAVWHGGRILVVRTSYHDLVDLPGGGIATGETPLQAAVRELREETGIDAPPGEVGGGVTFRYVDLHRRLTNHVFAWRPQAAPAPVADRREVVWTGLATPAELAAAKLSPLLRAYLEEGAGPAGPPPSGTRQISRA